MAIPTRFPGGITNVSSSNPMADFGLPDPTVWQVYFDDFNVYRSSDWTITTTEAGAGSASQSIEDEVGGWLKIQNDNADNDLTSLQTVGEPFLVVSSKKMIIKTKFRLNDVTQSDYKVGLIVRDTTPLSVNAGVYFSSTDGSASLDFNIAQGGTTTTESGIHTMVDNTAVELVVYYDTTQFVIFVDGVRVGSITDLTNIPTTELCITMFVQNGEADITNLFVDYLLIAAER